MRAQASMSGEGACQNPERVEAPPHPLAASRLATLSPQAGKRKDTTHTAFAISRNLNF